MKAFDEIILKSFPDKNVGPVVVTYKDGDWTGFSIAEGYLQAAERLAKTLDQTGLTASEDLLAFPILFLVRHSLELSLKGYILRLLDHRSKKCCGNLEFIDSSKLSGHELIPLYDSIYECIKGDMLHSYPEEFIKFKDLIYALDNEDLSSESLRYTKNNSGKTTLFFHDQKFIVVNSFVEIFRELSDCFEYWAENSVFDDCAVGLFRKDAKKSYEQAIELINRSQEMRERYQFSLPKKVRNKSDFMSVKEIAESFEESAESNLVYINEFDKMFSTENPDERALLAYALELCKGKDSGLSYFLECGNDFVEEYIQNNKMHFSRPNSIEELRARANKMIQMKAIWKPNRS